MSIIGIDDYDISTVAETVMIRLENGDQDYFIGYNRATGINKDTQSSRDSVTITQRGSDTGYSNSKLLASLSQSQVYTISNYKEGQSLFIRFTSHDPAVLQSGAAKVDIYHASCVPPGCTNQPAINSYGCILDYGRFDLKLLTDDYGRETSWTIKNANGTTLFSGSKYASNRPYDEGPFCLPPNAGYQFQMVDSAGDGLCCDYGLGSFAGKLTDFNGETQFIGGPFELTATYPFDVVAPPPPSPTPSPTRSPTRSSTSYPDRYDKFMTLNGNHLGTTYTNGTYAIYDCMRNVTKFYSPVYLNNIFS
jgi:hypothetical protein